MKPNTKLLPVQPLSYTAREAMQLLHIGPTTFYALVNSGKIKARKIGNKYLVLREELERVLRGEDAA